MQSVRRLLTASSRSARDVSSAWSWTGRKRYSDFATNRKNILKENKAYSNGRWIEAATGSTFPVHDPGNGELLAEIPDLSVEEVQETITAAHVAFKEWKQVPAKERGAALMKWRENILSHQEDLSYLITKESGKALGESRGEVSYACDFLQWYAEEARRTYGEVVPSSVRSKRVFMLRQPSGVSAQITPWNFPVSMMCRKAAPALAAGCPVVIKPAEDTPLSALLAAQLSEGTGIPPGVINIVTASRDNAGPVGKALCEHPLVASISFTGSTKIGKLLLKQSAEQVKKVSMELGGNGPLVVFGSADARKAAQGAFVGKFRNGGQACVGINRILVQEDVYDVFLEEFSALVAGIKVGYGLDEGVTLGPLVNHRSIDKIEALLSDAVQRGAEVVTGGTRHPYGENYFMPTIVTGVTPEMDIFNEEIFGPVASIVQFKTEEEAVELANDTHYGLSAYVFSEDHRQIWRMSDELEAGVLGINDCGVALAEGTFGGWKQSGLGREGAKFGIEEFMEVKYMCYGDL